MRCSYRTEVQPIHFLPTRGLSQLGQRSDRAPKVLDLLLRL